MRPRVDGDDAATDPHTRSVDDAATDPHTRSVDDAATDRHTRSVGWLASHLADANVRVADCRWYLGGKRGVDAYAAGHVPGAVFVDLDRDLADPSANGPGRHPLPSREAFVSTLARLGIGPATIVVAYDDAGGSIAARLWWMLRWIGHEGGRVLDGGIGAWIAAGHPLSTEVPVIEPVAPWTPKETNVRLVDKAAVDRLRTDRAARIFDARAAERYQGKVEPIDARPGHIPGAHSLPFAGNLAADGTFLDAAALRRRFEDAGAFQAGDVVAYCGSGVTACHDLLALAIAGREDAILYPGSWSDWARDPNLPAALGPEPLANSRDNGGEKR